MKGVASLLNLQNNIKQRFVRRKIFSFLVQEDRMMISIAHNKNKKIKLTREFGYYCAKNGYLELLKWAYAKGCPWDRWICAKAAANGYLEILQWARAQGCPE